LFLTTVGYFHYLNTFQQMLKGIISVKVVVPSHLKEMLQSQIQPIFPAKKLVFFFNLFAKSLHLPAGRVEN